MVNELYHHGTKGMKWGIRRWQNKDGSLTPAGRKRYGDDDSDNTPEKKSDNPAYSSARRSVKDMTDVELNTAINRLRNEQTYQQLYSQMHPQQVNKAKEFVSKAWDEAIQPAIIKSGKDAIEKFLTKTVSDAMGLNGDEALSAYDKLKKEADTLKLKAAIAKDKKNEQEDSYQYEKRKKMIDDEKAGKPSEEDLEKRAKAREEVNETKRQFDEMREKYNTEERSRNESKKEADRAAQQKAREDKFAAESRKETEKILRNIDSHAQKAADKQAKAEAKAQAKSDKYKEAYERAKESSKVYEGTVEGEGQSRFTGWKSDKNSKTYDVDFDWSNSEVKPTTSLSVVNSSPVRDAGQQFLNSFLLEDRSRYIEDKRN